VTPGAGDRPNWMDANEFGKVVAQFRSFAFAANQRILISGLQSRDASTLSGALMTVAIGTMIYGIKQTLAGREVSSDPAVYLKEGVDKSGIFGYLMDVNNIAEKVTRGQFGISPLIGGPPMSRFASRNAMSALAGPTLGTITDAISLAGSIAEGEIKESDVRRAKMMVPYQNVFYMRWLFDHMADGVSRGIGAK